MHSRKNNLVGEIPLSIAKLLHEFRVCCDFLYVLTDNRYGEWFNQSFSFLELASDPNLHDVAVKHLRWLLAGEPVEPDLRASRNIQMKSPCRFFLDEITLATRIRKACDVTARLLLQERIEIHSFVALLDSVKLLISAAFRGRRHTYRCLLLGFILLL